jgi:hypothetical protein
MAAAFKKILIFATLALFCSQSLAQWNVQQSHINGNVPDASDFRALLERDLLAYFRDSTSPSATSVEYKLLRDVPTQSGVAFPKYYAWVKVFAGSLILQEGAVRIAAIQRTQFEVTDFISPEQIKSNPSSIKNIFPAPLVPAVLSLADAK